MRSFEHHLSESASQQEVLGLVQQLNNDREVNGILVQLPLPKHLDETEIINSIDPAKDVDGFHLINTGKLATNQPCIVPCTPLGCLMMIKDNIPNLTGKRAVIVGRSNIVGKPMAQLLLQEHCTVTITHSRTKDLEAECRRADILVAAVGVEEIIRGEWIKPGAVVVDVGINRVLASDGKYKLVGDVCFSEAEQIASAITPVPGGVGPMTIACLLHNTLEVTCRQNAIEFNRLQAA
jgi:methylenetetrahydrofolate dehydrogenase (NADP+)/methenyltetrahydrofolate cyclohydrolase